VTKATAAFFCLLTAAPLAEAQQVAGPATLDSGTVVRLHWAAGKQKATLLAPLGPKSPTVRYCIYPSNVCGESTLNPPVTRPVAELTRVDVRRGTAARRGALTGAAAGAAGGLLFLLGQALRDAPAMSTGQQVAEVAASASVWGGIGALIGAAGDNWEPVPQKGEP
jgi:hypothetical protein